MSISALASVDEFIDRVKEYLSSVPAPWPVAWLDEGAFIRLAPLIQERVATLAEVAPLVGFLFDDPFVVDEVDFDKMVKQDDGALEILEGALAGFMEAEWTAGSLRGIVEAIGERMDRKLGKVQAPIRVATLGSRVGLPLFESLEELGRERTIARLDVAIGRGLE